ncbi:MAG: carbohydrate ABC transporter permease [Anaerolineae bacterium]|nr:carbohydrate ABC transporter permease [Anaerolineae bacterium]
MMAGKLAGERRGARKASWRENRRLRTRLALSLAYLVIVLGAVVVVFPFFWQVTTSLKSPRDVFRWPPVWVPSPLHPENYSEVARVVPMVRYVRNSLTICLPTILGTLISCSLAAYGFARLRFRGRDLIFLVLISPMILPWAVYMVPQFVMFHRAGWYDTYLPLIVPTFFGDPFFIFLLRQFFLGIPLDLEDAARIDGAGYLATFARIILPLATPALATVAIFRFMWSWNDFFGPLIYVSDQRLFTLPLGLAFFQGSPRSAVQMHLLMAIATIIVIPCLLVYFFAQRLFIQGIVFTGVKG